MKLFISYRRKDWPFTRSLVEKLRQQLHAQIFVDVDSIHEDDFMRNLMTELATSDAVLLIISPNTFDPERINSPDDWVRREVGQALALGKPLIMAGIDGLTPPPASALPEDIRAVTNRQCIEFLPRYFDAGVLELTRFIEKATPIKRRASMFRRWALRGALALALVLLVGIIIFVATQPAAGPLTPTATATSSLPPDQLALAGVTRNAAWTPFERRFDGVPMMLVPAGCFNMGSTNGNDDEKPVTNVCFDKPFWIDKTEVTQAQFRLFGGKAAMSAYFPGDQRPVERITWAEAQNFCAVRGARLPTEAEWEYAARGPDNQVYAWGNDWEGRQAVWDRTDGTVNVGSIPAGVSWIGALDVAGNVWEWTASMYRPYPYNKDDGRENTLAVGDLRVLRGASWLTSNPLHLRAPARLKYDPNRTDDGIGLRCLRS